MLDESFLLLFNGHHQKHVFTLPESQFGDLWTIVLDTARPELETATENLPAAAEIDVIHHSLVLLRRVQG